MDVIVHMAAALQGSRESMLTTAVDGARNVAEAAARQGAKRVIYLSSMSVYDYTTLKDGESIMPDSPLEAQPQARGAYSWSKRLAEDVALAHLGDKLAPWTILRPSLVVGDGGDVLGPLGIKAGSRVICCGRSSKNLLLIHVDDVAAAVESVIRSEATAGRVFTLSLPQALPLRDYLAAVRKRSENRVRVIYVPYAIAWIGAQCLTGIHKVMGRGPLLSRQQLRYLYSDLSSGSETLIAATSWRPRKHLADELVQ